MIAERVAAAKAEATEPFKGIDVDKYRKFEADEAEAARKAEEAKGNYETILQKKDAEHTAELGRIRSELDGLKKKSTVEAEAARQNAIDPSQVYLLVNDKLRISDDGSVEAVGPDGKPIIKDGKIVTPAGVVSDFLAANPHFVRAGKSGSGAGGDGGSGTGSPSLRKVDELDMSKPADREYYRSHYVNPKH